MDKATLKQYRKIKREIEQLYRLMKELDRMLGGSVRPPDGMPRAKGHGDSTGNLASKRGDLFNFYRDRLEHLVDLQKQIELVINGLQDAEERGIMRARYIEGKSMRQISKAIHSSKTSVYRKHDVALKKIASM